MLYPIHYCLLTFPLTHAPSIPIPHNFPSLTHRSPYFSPSVFYPLPTPNTSPPKFPSIFPLISPTEIAQGIEPSKRFGHSAILVGPGPGSDSKTTEQVNYFWHKMKWSQIISDFFSGIFSFRAVIYLFETLTLSLIFLFLQRLVFTGGSDGNDLIRNGRDFKDVRTVLHSSALYCSLTYFMLCILHAFLLRIVLCCPTVLTIAL